MPPFISRQQQEFTLPSQLSKSKLTLKGDKIIRKENLRSKVNIPKMTVDSENEDIQEKQQQIAKRKAKKWWKSFNKKYYAVFNTLEDAQSIINKIQETPINDVKLRTYFEEQFLNQDTQSGQTFQRADTIRVLFRRQIALDEKQYHNLLFYELANTVSNQMIDEQVQNSFVHLNGQQIQVSTKIEYRFPSNVNIWAFRNPSKDSRAHNEGKSICSQIYQESQKLTACYSEQSTKTIQKLLRYQKQNHSQNSIQNEIKQWSKNYHEIFEQNQKCLQNLALRIEQNIDKRKLEEELKQRQQQIVILTQKELLWSQILLLFKKGHSDKTEQLLNDAMQIMTIKEMNMKQSLRKKKSTSQQKLKSLFETDCKICFSTESDEKINKVFYCDGCNTSFHQICYGISKEEADNIILMEKFYCDVCNYQIVNKTTTTSKRSINSINLQNDGKMTEKSQTKQKKPCCQICCKTNFPMKMINNHFYHVTCLFLFDFAQVKDNNIFIKQNITFTEIFNRVAENEVESSLCEFCLKYQGMKFKCESKDCNKWYHPICAYLNGIYFNIKRNFRKLKVNLFCYDHQPCSERNIINQVYIRRFFCDYKKTSNLNQEDFDQQYARQIKQLSKDRTKQLSNGFSNLLLRKTKMFKQTGLASSGLLVGGLKKNASQNLSNYESCQYIRLQQSMAESSQQNELDIQRNELFVQKMDHARFIEEDLDFN